MNKTNGQVSGTPKAKVRTGSYSVVIRVQDSKVKKGPEAHAKESAFKSLILVLS